MRAAREGAGKGREEEHEERESRANKIHSGKTAICKCHKSGRGEEWIQEKEIVMRSKSWGERKQEREIVSETLAST